MVISYVGRPVKGGDQSSIDISQGQGPISGTVDNNRSTHPLGSTTLAINMSTSLKEVHINGTIQEDTIYHWLLEE